jgi:hypothetical protein
VRVLEVQILNHCLGVIGKRVLLDGKGSGRLGASSDLTMASRAATVLEFRLLNPRVPLFPTPIPYFVIFKMT